MRVVKIILFIILLCFSVMAANNNAGEAGQLAKESSLRPENEDFYVAQKAFSEGFYEAAGKLFKEFIGKYPQSQKLNEAKLFMAKSLFYRNSFKEAEEILSELINADLSSQIKPQVLHWLGEINFQAKKYEKAKDFFKEVRQNLKQSFLN